MTPTQRPAPPASARTASALPATALRGGRTAPPPSRAKVWLALLGVGIVCGALAAGLVFRTMSSKATSRAESPVTDPAEPAGTEDRRRDRAEEPIADRETRAREEAPSERAEAPADPAPTRASKRASEAVSGSGRMQIDFEHPLKSGTLKVWVDDNLVLDEELSSPTFANLKR